ncbi:hypothetical protein I5Q34_08190 [Streptomyces sp. AV19]|uniref:hypothetical protein n=1 Tax=Streptomyces sp. AV19 TaxID=2793068 RepID=UPI0018FE5822|nr:hypothetical protein [Streptomyces sp. AV19]MBH1934274.1 hypothetical protein [Streptomyces sp. AV19]MDG4533415.1 hypothetical protein [Streptomyces sp. AV19]
MHNQRTPLPIRESEPVPPAWRLAAVLRKVAEFLESLPGLPAPSVTVDVHGFTLQFAYLPSGEAFPAVARLGQMLGAEPEFQPLGIDNWYFQARGRLGELNVTAFASTRLITDPVYVETRWR